MGFWSSRRGMQPIEPRQVAAGGVCFALSPPGLSVCTRDKMNGPTIAESPSPGQPSNAPGDPDLSSLTMWFFQVGVTIRWRNKFSPLLNPVPLPAGPLPSLSGRTRCRCWYCCWRHWSELWPVWCAACSNQGVHWLATQRFALLADRPWWQLGLLGFGFSALLGFVGYFLTHTFAPEAGGSGIPEIEGAMDDLRPVRWWRVLPVKFFGGICTLSSGMVLGREGPSVQIGGNLGMMVADIFRLPKEHGHALLAAGAAGGLAAAFNAPLAGILFVMEEMRPQFRYSFLAIKAVGISAIMATLMLQNMKGQGAVITLPHYDAPALKALWLFLLMGATFGVLGFVFNKLVLACQDGYLALHQNKRHRFVAIGMLVAGTFGVLSLFATSVTGGGTELIPHLIGGEYGMATLFLIFSVRLVATLICFCSGAPGGVFAPTLALGTLFGVIFGHLFHAAFPRTRHRARCLCHRRDGGAVCRHRARPHHRHSAGHRDDRQLSADPAHDGHHGWRDPGGAVAGRPSHLFPDP